MAYDMVKYERGQVWVIRFKNPTMVGHEQQKDRPWLIISIGVYNESSGMVTAVPFTTRDTVVSPAQVLMSDMRGKNSVILCEQIRSFDYKSGAYIFDYMGKVSDSVLEKVDVALSIHTGMHYSPITLNKLYESMESIIKSVGYMQDKEKTPKFTDDDVLDFAEKLQSLVTVDPVEEEVATTIEIPIIIQEDAQPVEVKSKRISWTPEVCQQFLDDADRLPIDVVMENWSISKKTRFYSMKNYAQNIMKKYQTRT